MTYTNSPLVSYINISPNKTVLRNMPIDRITPHVYVGQVTVQDMAAWLCNKSAQASANYGIGKDGRIGLFVEEKDRSWCSSSSANDNRAITIECASDKTDPYAINKDVYNSLIELMVDICRRNGKKKLLWLGSKDKTLNYTPAHDEMVLTVHRWFANKACPGDYVYNKLGTIAKKVSSMLAETNIYPEGAPVSKDDFIDKVSKIAMELYAETKIIPSVVVAQCCLETGYGLGSDSKSLVQRNNLLGMKSELLNSTWQEYSVWDGTSYIKKTPEYINGELVYKYDSFRVYKNYENCIRDYEMFLLNVKSNGAYKYRKVSGKTDPKEVITIISKGGYATDPSYITKVMKIIEENHLTKYDAEVLGTNPVPIGKIVYRVQLNAYTYMANAKKFITDVKKKSKLDCFYELGDDSLYHVYCGSFESKKNADERLTDVKELGYTNAFIVEVKLD